MADITVTVNDMSVFPPRTDTVVLPGIPRQGDSFQWDDGGPVTNIQTVTWNGHPTTGGIVIQVS